jgi:hypothetical protein
MHSATYWSRHPGLNRGPTDYESVALPLSYVGIPPARPVCSRALRLVNAPLANSVQNRSGSRRFTSGGKRQREVHIAVAVDISYRQRDESARQCLTDVA